MSAVFCVTLSAAPAAATAETVDVYTDYWPPYVNREGDVLGEAARIVRLAVDNMGAELRWQYFDFAYGYHKVTKGTAALSFPWFRTPEREGQVAFSDPLFEATSRVYYNRQFQQFTAGVPVDFTTCRIARVAGYRYGPEVDAVFGTADEIQTETDAIAALLAGEIDLLPMTERVADAILRADFSDRRLLLLALDAPVSTSNLYAVAPDTPQGRERLENFNQSLNEVADLGLADLPSETATGPIAEEYPEVHNGPMQSCAPVARVRAECANDDASCGPAIQGEVQGTQVVATIVTSEGFPAAIASDPLSAQGIPLVQGTRVFVISWQAGVAPGDTTPRVFEAMTQQAEVVVLNGPYVGRQVRIPQMHLAIAE